MEQILDLLRKSLEDKVLISKEKKQLKKQLRQMNLAKRERDFLRSQVFDLARNNIGGNDISFVLNWLEEVNKLLLYKGDRNKLRKVFFSPGDECRSAIIYNLKKAITSVKICVFTISDDLITQAILDCQGRNIAVQIISDDKKSTDMGSDIEKLANEGLNVKIDKSPSHMHHKFAIVDNRIAITGSYNWTRSAAMRNQENLLITNDKTVVKSFLKEFDQLWQKMTPY